MTTSGLKPILICLALSLASCGEKEPISPASIPYTPIFPDLPAPGPYEKAYSMTQSGDGTTRVFVRESPGETNLYKITKGSDGVWTSPERLDLPKTVSNTSPHFSPFDDRLYYASDAPFGDDPRIDMNIWSVDWNDGSWGTPAPVSGDVNTLDNETGVTTDRLGNMFFVSKHARGQGAQDIYTATQNTDGDWKTVFLPEHINSPRVETHIAVSPDGSTLIFYSYQTPKIGKVDLVASVKTDEGWQAPVNLGPNINTPGDDMGAGFSYDGDTFFWSRDGILLSTSKDTIQDLISQATQTSGPSSKN